MDGRLIVMPPPICLVKLELVDAEPQMEGLEEAENDAIKKSNNACLYSATNKDLAKRVFGELGLHLDDFVVLSQFECQITGIPPETGADQATKKYKTLTRGRFVPLHSQRPLVRKLGIVVQSNLIPSVESLERPRASPGQNQALLDSETEHNENVAPMPRLVKKRPVHPLLAKKRALDPSKTPTGKSTIITTTFPDASGMINIPNSILKVLRPHQVSGVTFLWNVLTGASSELQAAASSAHVDNVRGCILADEVRLEEHLGATEALAAHRDDVPVRKLIRLLLRVALGRRLHLRVEVQGDVAKLLLNVANDFSLGGRREGVAALCQDLHHVFGQVSTSQVKTQDRMRQGVALVDRHRVRDAIAGVHHNARGAA